MDPHIDGLLPRHLVFANPHPTIVRISHDGPGLRCWRL
jgi:hypothetical protein